LPISFRTPVSVTAASGAGFTMPVPAAVAVGDFVVAVVANAGTSGPAAPAGWSRDYSASAGSGQCCSIFTAQYSAGLTRAFTNAASAAVAVCGSYYQAGATVTLGALLAATNTTNNTTLPTGAPVTGTSAGEFEVLAYAHAAAPTVTTTAAGSTIDLRAVNGTSCTAILGHNNTTSLGASVTCTAFSHTLSANQNRKTGVGVLLRAVVYKDLTGSAAGTSTTTSVLDKLRLRLLTGTAAGTSTASAVLDKIPGSFGDVAGSADGAATTQAVLTRRRRVAGAAAGTSTASAVLTRQRALSAVSLGRATVTGAPTRRRRLVGTSAGRATADATIEVVPAVMEFVLWGTDRFDLEGAHPSVLWGLETFRTTGDYPAVYWHDGKFKVPA
jgi:hypothetical protein